MVRLNMCINRLARKLKIVHKPVLIGTMRRGLYPAGRGHGTRRVKLIVVYGGQGKEERAPCKQETTQGSR